MLLRIGGVLCSLIAMASCATPEFDSAAVTEADVAAEQPIAREIKPNDRGYIETVSAVRRVKERLRSNINPICYHVSGRICRFNVHIETNNTVNAYATGEGKIVLFTGLLRYLHSDDEIAAVLSHEIAHHAANHLNEKLANMKTGAAVGAILVGSIVVAAGGSQRDINDGMEAGAKAGAKLGAHSYSIDQENEADYLAAYMMDAAGYDIRAGVAVHDMLSQVNGSATFTPTSDKSYLATHPTSPEREARMKKSAEEIAVKKALRKPVLPGRARVSSAKSTNSASGVSEN